MKKPQYHVSGIDKLSKCGIQFENQVLLKIPASRSVALVVGSAVDRAVSADMDSKKDTGSALPVEQVRDIARDALVDTWKNGTPVMIDAEKSYINGAPVVVTDEDADDGWSPAMGDAIDASVDLAAFYHKEVAPSVAPTHVQRKWVLDVAGLNIQIAGAIDVQEGTMRLRDTKTTAKSPPKNLADTSLQLSMYSLAIKQLDGEFPRIVQLDKLVRTPKRKDLKYVPLESTRGAEDMPPLIARIENAARVVNSGIFTPAPTDSWQCSKKYCSYWGVCPYAMHPKSLAVNGSKG